MSDKPDNSAATADFVAELKASVAPAAAPNPSESKKTFIDPQDGTVFEWDDEKKAWFPKVARSVLFSITRRISLQVDEEFIAGYQANYGFTPEAQEWSKRAAEAAALPPEKPQKKKKAEVCIYCLPRERFMTSYM